MELGVAIELDDSAESAVASADEVDVVERAGEPTRFRLRYALSHVDEDFPLLTEPRVHGSGEISVLTGIGGGTQCLVRGPVLGHKVHFQNGVTDSWIEIGGGDRSLVMDREVVSQLWSGKASSAVAAIAQRHGFEGDVADTASEYGEAGNVLVQRDSDLRFVRRIARRYGFLFWVTCDAEGVATAHFRRPQLDGEVAATLSLNSKTANLESLDLDWDMERPAGAVAAQISLADKGAMDGAVPASPLTGLGGQPYSEVATALPTMQVIAPAVDGGDLRARAEAALIEAGWFVRARCRTSVRALGVAVHAASVVVVEGIGKRHSGRYFVGAVHHHIGARGHVMDLSLYRNAWEG